MACPWLNTRHCAGRYVA